MTADPVSAQEVIASVGQKLREPGPNEKVFKDECIYCFVTPFFPDGLFVCLSKFVGLCKDHIGEYRRRTGATLFLNMKYEKPENKEDSEKPEDKDKNKIVHKYSLRMCPNLEVELSTEGNESDAHVQKIIKTIIDHKSAHLQENSEQGLEWDGTEVFESDIVENLVQLDVKKQIPEDGWVCEHPGCEIKQNLWINLSDAFVGCGRLSHGSKYEGQGHAEVHARETGFVLVVRVATIENEIGECFQYNFGGSQYSNDQYVKNPFLKRQLAHFGLDINKFTKTEEHRDVLNANYNMTEFFAIEEKGTELEAIFGPGFTGLINLGSSCYINSVLQLLLSIPDFVQAYDKNSEQIFLSKDPVDSHDDFNCQFAKVVHCLNSAAEYSQRDSKLNGIKPVQFRRIVGKGHYEFSTAKQQDVEQYIRHLFEKVDANVTGEMNPVNAVRYISVNRFVDVASSCVRYRQHNDYILPLTVPMEASEQSKDDAERRTIGLEKCIAATFSEESIDGYVSPITGTAGGAKQAIRMGSFPDFLLVQLKRFAYNAVGEQEKLKVDVENVGQLDLTAYFSEGLQPSETALPEDSAEQKSKPSVVDEETVAMITSMGYDVAAARRAVKMTNNSGADAALNYLLDNTDVPMEEEPVAPIAGDPANVQVRRGAGTYQLQGFISHIGSSPSSGHYVVHLNKDGKWYIYNDEKVAVSQNPPYSMGYVYLYKRSA